MFVIHYVSGPGNDEAIDKETFDVTDIEVAKNRAMQRLRNTNLATTYGPNRPHPTGFHIYDAAGSQLLYREYLS